MLKKLKKIIFIIISKLSNKNKYIDYHFNMADYFTLDNKIEENRKRIRELFEQYKKTESYYPLFFAYLGFTGVYSFNIVQYLIFNYSNHVFGLTLFIIHALLFCFCFFLFIRILFLKPFGNDPLPKDVYVETYNLVKQRFPNEAENDIEEKTKEAYLKTLEEEVEFNYNIYEKKKEKLSILIKVISFSFIIYVILILTFKVIVMADSNEKKANVQKEQQDPVKKVIKTDDTNKLVDIKTRTRRIFEGLEPDSSKTLLKD